MLAANFESGPFTSRDGTRLFAHWHRPQTAPRGVAIVLHGYADHGGRYGEVCRQLTEIGLAALAPDYRGHGRADGQRGHIRSFKEYLFDLDASVARARAAVPSGPLFLVGHSMGSLLTLRAMCDPTRAPRADGVVLSSPFLGMGMPVPQAKLLAGRIASRVYPALSLPNALKVEDFTHDELKQRETEADDLRHAVATARWFTEVTAAQQQVRDYAWRLDVPSLWLVGAADPIVDVKVTRAAFARAGGDKQLRLYEGYYHEIFNEIGRQTVFGDLRRWISSKFFAS